MPRPHPNPLVRARERHVATAPTYAELLAIPLSLLINAECGVPHKIPVAYFDHYDLTKVTPNDGHDYQNFRRSRRQFYRAKYLPQVGCVVPSDFSEFLDGRQWKPLDFARKFCVPEVEVYRAYLGKGYSVTLREVFDAD